MNVTSRQDVSSDVEPVFEVVAVVHQALVLVLPQPPLVPGPRVRPVRRRALIQHVHRVDPVLASARGVKKTFYLPYLIFNSIFLT